MREETSSAGWRWQQWIVAVVGVYLLVYLMLRMSGYLYVDPYGFFRSGNFRVPNVIAPTLSRAQDTTTDAVVLTLWFAFRPLCWMETTVRNGWMP